MGIFIGISLGKKASRYNEELVIDPEILTGGENWIAYNNVGATSSVSIGELHLKNDATNALTSIEQITKNLPVGASVRLTYTVSENLGGTNFATDMTSPATTLLGSVGTHEYDFTLATNKVQIKRTSANTDLKISYLSIIKLS